MRKLVLTPKFTRAYRASTRRDRALQVGIETVLKQIQEDVFAPSLGTHKLSGVLSGLWACSCGYDCRIVFSLESDPDTAEEIIVLLDIGTHDEVY
jgi:mRNA interferase YafQ